MSFNSYRNEICQIHRGPLVIHLECAPVIGS